MLLLAKKYWAKEHVRFLAIGGFNTVFGLLFFYVIQYLFGKNVGYLGSLYISFAVVTIVSFTLYRVIVFKVNGHLFSDFYRFLLVYLFPLGLNTIALPLLVTFLELNVYLAQTLFVAISTVVSYLGHKYFSFRRRLPEGQRFKEVSPSQLDKEPI